MLAVYGWVLIAVGALCGLLALLSAAILLLARSAPSERALAVRPQGVLINVLVYLGLAAVFVALGSGSIRARRWAVPLTLTVVWIWLASGILGFLVMALLVPGILSSALTGPSSSGIVSCATVFLLLFVALFFVALPLVLLLFYRREDVRRTVEARNPLPGWTDKVPLSILGIVLALAAGGAASVLSALAIRAVPLFGTVLTGWPAALALLSFGAVSIALALPVYRLSLAGWWGLIALQVVGLASFLTLRGLDVQELLRQMGYPEDQASLAGQIDIFGNPVFLASMAAAWIALLAFLLSVRRHFRRGGTKSPI